MKTRRAFLVEPRRFEVREIEINPGPGQILVKVAACGICNWEVGNHWKGQLGACPQSLGHEWGGTVAAIGEGVTDVAVGDVVTGMPEGLFGFSDYLIATQGYYFKLAPHVKPEHALGEPLKCIITVLRGAAPEAGDIVVVVGCGPMRLWCIQGLAGNMLAALVAVDVDDNKLELAHQFGATHVINPKKEDAVTSVAKISGGRMADFVIEGTGIPAVLSQAVSYLKKGRGRLAMMSAHESSANEFDFRPAQDKGIEIRVTHPDYSLNELDDMRRAVALIDNNTFKMDDIISHRFSLMDVQRGFETCEHKPGGYIKGVIIP